MKRRLEKKEQIDAKNKEHEKVDKKKEAAEKALAGKSTRDFDKVTQDIRDKEADISKKKPAFYKGKGEVFSHDQESRSCREVLEAC
jgi:structural maintenance of chromosome 1